MGPTDPGRQHVLPAGAEHGGTESGPQARWFSVCSGSSRPLSTMSCSSEKRRPLDICMKPRRFCCPLVGGGAQLRPLMAASPARDSGLSTMPRLCRREEVRFTADRQVSNLV